MLINSVGGKEHAGVSVYRFQHLYCRPKGMYSQKKIINHYIIIACRTVLHSRILAMRIVLLFLSCTIY